MRAWLQAQKASLALLVLAVTLLFFGLGSYGLLEDNEARFFEISWEMARSGDWVTPHLNFIEHFHKPPGTFWLVGGSLKLFGASEWAGRLPVALAALSTLALTALWTARESGATVARRSVLVLVTCVEFWFLSRLVLTDMFLALSVTSAFFWAWRCRSGEDRCAWLWFWVSLVASALFKGPIGLAIVLPVLTVFQLTSPQRSSWNLRPALGIPLFLALSLPWYAVVCAQNEGLLAYFLRFQTAQRMLTTVHGRPGPWWFYLPVLLAGFFPWSPGLLLSLPSAWRRRSDFDRLLLLWIVLPVLFFSCAGSKLPTYLLPIYPALAMLTARCSGHRETSRRLGLTALTTLAFFGVALAGYLAIGVAPELAPAIPQLIALAALTLTSVVVALGGKVRLTDSVWFAWPGVTFALGLLLLASALGPCDSAYSSRALALTVQSRQPVGGDVVEVADHLHGLPFYLNQRVVQVAYPRETQFESTADYQHYLFPDIPSYLASRKLQPSTLFVMRRPDYENYAAPSWTHWNVGPWVLARPLPSAAPAHPTSAPATNSGLIGGRACLQ